MSDRALFLGILAAVGFCFWQGATPGDPVASHELYRFAEPSGLEQPAAVDAARLASHVRPWQAGFAEARAERERVVRARQMVKLVD